MKKNLWAEIIGWYGTIAILTAYALVSFSLLNVQNPIYQILNATGAIGIVIISLSKKAYQPATLNAIWTVIALISLLQIYL